jgi:hypothetical protein
MSRNASIQLRNSGEINEFITYLQDSNNDIFLKNLKTLSLDINLYDGITSALYQLGSSMFNVLKSQFITTPASETPKFEQLIDQLQHSPVKNLHLKLIATDINYITYLASIGLSNLKRLDLSTNNIEATGATELVNGNLNLDVLVLNKKDTDAIAIFANKNSKTKLYLSCMGTRGTNV